MATKKLTVVPEAEPKAVEETLPVEAFTEHERVLHEFLAQKLQESQQQLVQAQTALQQRNDDYRDFILKAASDHGVTADQYQFNQELLQFEPKAPAQE